MAEEEEFDLGFNKLNIDSVRKLSRNGECSNSLPTKPKELAEGQDLYRLTFSGEVCARKNCQCNSNKKKYSSESVTSWSQRFRHVNNSSHRNVIIHAAKLKLVHKNNHAPILKNPTLKLMKPTNFLKKKSKFMKLDDNNINLLKENSSLIKLTNVVKSQPKKFGEKTGNLIDFKSLSINGDSNNVSNNVAIYEGVSFRFHRDCRITETEVLSNPQQSCAQQARNAREDVTINELAGYFENLVHIPKKMSHMAEQMYT